MTLEEHFYFCVGFSLFPSNNCEIYIMSHRTSRVNPDWGRRSPYFQRKGLILRGNPDALACLASLLWPNKHRKTFWHKKAVVAHWLFKEIERASFCKVPIGYGWLLGYHTVWICLNAWRVFNTSTRLSASKLR